MEAGSSLGPYEILEPLGTGGMGEVYLSRDTRLGRKAALKVVGDRLKSDPSARDALMREARTASNLNHPHICTIYDVGEDSGQPYIGMEYVEGQSLSDLLTPDGLPIETVVRYGTQIADALAYAHESGVVHRDLKSLNVMVTPERRVKILDFGLARRLVRSELDQTMTAMTTLTGPGQIAGTLPYMAPELLRGASADRRSDIWALGVVLYEMATGQLPFQGKTGFALSSAIMNEAPVALPASVPSGLTTVIHECLAKEPEQRYRQASEVRAALAALRFEGGMERAVSAPSVRRSSNRLRPTVVAIGIILASVLVAWRIYEKLKKPPLVSTTRVAVFPFVNRGGNEIAHLGEECMHLLTDVFSGTAEIHPVDPRAVLGLVAQEERLTPEHYREIASRLGAGRYVIGDVFEAADRVRVTAAVYKTENDSEAPFRASIEGQSNDPFTMINELAVEVLGALGLPSSELRVASLKTSSIDALNAYFRGDAAFRTGQFDSAAAAFEHAFKADSLFALAWYRFAVVSDYLDRWDEGVFALDRALDLKDRLSERDQRLAEAFKANYTDMDVDRAERLYRGIIADYPNDVEAWNGLGELYISSFYRGLNLRNALDSYNHILSFEPMNWVARAMEFLTYGLLGDVAAIDSTTARLLHDFPNTPFTPMLEAILAFARRDVAAQQSATTRLRDMPDTIRMVTVVNTILFFCDFEDGKHLTSELLTRADRVRETQALGHAIIASLELAQGRLAEAKDQLRMAQDLDRAYGLEYRGLLLLAPFLGTPDTELQELYDELVEWDPTTTPSSESGGPWINPHERVHGTLRLYLLALLAIRLGNHDMAVTYAKELEKKESSGLGVNPTEIARIVRAHIAIGGGDHPEDPNVLSGALTAASKTWISPFFSQVHERFLRAAILNDLGRSQEALSWYEPVWKRGALDVIYKAPSHLRQGEIYERLGRLDEARQQYAKFVELWADADPELQPRVQEVRQRIERLGGS